MSINHRMMKGLLLGVAVAAGLSHTAHAFDPFTIIAVGSATANAIESIGSVAESAAEVSQTLSLTSDLASEFNEEAGYGDPDPTIEKIHEIERLGYEAGYTQSELDDLLSDSRSSESRLNDTLRKMKRSISLTKRVLALAGVSSKKAAEIANIEQVKSRKEEKEILINIHRELVDQKLSSQKSELQRQKKIQESIKELKAAAAKVAPNGNLRLFPVQSSLIARGIDAFKSYRSLILLLVSLVVMARLIYYQMSLSGTAKYGDLLQDAVVCYFLMLTLPLVFSHLSEISTALSVSMNRVMGGAGPESLPSTAKLDTQGTWWWSVDALRPIAYLPIYGLFNLVLGILIALGPIVILAGTVLNLSIGVSVYLGALISIWLWPVLWNTFGYFGHLLRADGAWNTEGIVSGILGVAFYLLQLVSPVVALLYAAKTKMGQAAKTGGATYVAGGKTLINSRIGQAGIRSAKQGFQFVSNKIKGPALQLGQARYK